MKQRKSILGYIKSRIERINQISLTEDSNIANTVILENAKINGKIILEEGVKIVHGVTLIGNSKITIGKHSILNGPNTSIYCKINEVTIGNYCSIARNVTIQEYNHNYSGISTYFVTKNVLREKNDNDIYSKGAVIIQNDVWVSAQCVILGGVTIGNGAIIAANSVIINDVPPYSIVGGSPAKLICYRFEKEIIKRLLEIEWWYWSTDKIKKHKNLFSKKNISLADLEFF